MDINASDLVTRDLVKGLDANVNQNSMDLNEFGEPALEQAEPSQAQVDLFRQMLDRQGPTAPEGVDPHSDYLAGLGDRITDRLVDMQLHHADTSAVMDHLVGLDPKTNPNTAIERDQRAADIGPFDDPSSGRSDTRALTLGQLLDSKEPQMPPLGGGSASGQTASQQMQVHNFDGMDTSSRSIGQLVNDASGLTVVDQRQQANSGGGLLSGGSDTLQTASQFAKDVSQHAMQKSITASVMASESHMMVTMTANASAAITSNVKTLMRGS